MVRKLLSATLSAALLLASPGGPGWLPFIGALAHAEEAPAALDHERAWRYLQDNIPFSGDGDPLRSHFYNEEERKVTAVGEVLYQFLQAAERQAMGRAASSPSPAAGGSPPDPAAAARNAVAQRLEGFRDTFESLRRIGQIRTPEQRAQVEAAVQAAMQNVPLSEDFRRLTAEMEGRGLEAGVMELDMRLRAAFDAQSRAARGDAEYIQINTPDGYVFVDDQGPAYRQAKVMTCSHPSWSAQTEPWTMTFELYQERRSQLEEWGYTCGEGGGVTHYSREIRLQQENMNRPENRPPGAPEVPETGRYNYQMLRYGVARMEHYVNQLERNYHLERMRRLATQVQKQFRDDQFVREGPGGELFYNERLMRELEAEAAQKEINERDGVCRQTVANARELVDCRLGGISTELNRAKESLERYRAQVDLFSNRQLITEAEIAEVTGYERSVQLGATRAAVESYDLVIAGQMESLGFELDVATVQRPRAEEAQFSWLNPTSWGGRAWYNPLNRNWEFNGITHWTEEGLIRWTEHETPDYQFLREAIRNAPVSEEVREKYAERAHDTALGLGRLRLTYGELRERLRNVDPNAGFDDLQPMFNAAQAELNEAQLDFQLFASLPAISKALHDSVSDNWWGIFSESKKAVAAAWYWAQSHFDGGAGERDYWANQARIQEALPVFTRAMELMAEGDRQGARRELLAISGPALQGMSVDAFQRQGGITDAARLSALLNQLQRALTDKGKADLWFDTAVNLGVWSVGLALAAPIAAPMLQGAGMLASSAGQAIGAVRWVGWLGRPFTMAGAVMQHTAARLFTLSPAAQNVRGPLGIRQLHAFLYRTGNAGWRIGSFAGLAGGMSGLMGLYMPPIFGQPGGHYWNKDSPHASGWDAFKESAGHGAKWATDSWHPMLLFAGMPVTAFEGSRLARLTTSLANRGVMGNGLALMRWTAHNSVRFIRWVGRKLGRTPSSKVGMGARVRGWAAHNIGDPVARAGARLGEFQAGRDMLGLGRNAMMVVQMADHMGKFMGIGFAAKWLGERYVHARGIDGDDIERRIKRAQQEGLKQMELPYWLFLPVPAAVHEADGRAHQQSLEGLRQYREAGLEWKIANGVPDATELPFLHKPRGSWMDFIFNKQWGGDRGTTGTFRVNDTIRLQAMRSALPKELVNARGGRPVRVGELDPHQLHRISNMEEGQVGRLRWDKEHGELPQEAAALLRDYLRRRPDVAEKILFAREGEMLTVNGRSFEVKAQFREEVAQYAMLDSLAGRPVSRRLLAQSRELLKDTLAVQEARAGLGRRLVESLLAARPKDYGKQTAERMRREADDWAIQSKALIERRNRLEANMLEAKGTAKGSAREHIQMRLDDLAARRTAREGRLTEVRGKIRQARDRLETETNPAQVVRLRQRLENLLLKEKGLQERLVRLERYRKNGERRLREVGDKTLEQFYAERLETVQKQIEQMPTWEQMLAKWRTELTPDIKSGKLDRSFGDFLDYMEGAAPEFKTLRDAKGTQIPGWRPDQFSIQVEFFTSLLEGGRVNAANMKYVLKAGTGVGKTMVYGVGLLPFLEAYAARMNIKMIFATVKSNLLAQAKGDFRAYRRILTKTEFMTYSEFQAKLAEGKLDLGTGPKDWLIMGDEVDGGALQAQLSIGMGTGHDSYTQTGHRMLMDMDKTMRSLLDQGLSPRQMARTWRGMASEQVHLVRRSTPAEGVRRGLFDFLRRSSPQARRLEANAARIHRELRTGRDGWQVRVRALLDQRAQLVDAAVSRRNPITEAYGYGARRALKWARDRQRTMTDAYRMETAVHYGRNFRRLARRLEKEVAELERQGRRSEAQVLRTHANTLNSHARELLGSKRLRLLAERAEGKAAQLEAQGRHSEAKIHRDRANALRARSFGTREGINPKEVSLRQELRQLDRRVEAADRELSRIGRLYERDNVSPSRKAQLREERIGAKNEVDALVKRRKDMVEELAPYEREAILWLGKRFKVYEGTVKDAASALESQGAGEASAALRQARRMLGPKGGLAFRRNLLEWHAEKFHARAAKQMASLARGVSLRMMWAYLRDPFIAPQVRWQQFWKYFGSFLFPRFGFGGRGSFALQLVYGMAMSSEYIEGFHYQLNRETGKIEIIVGSDSLPGLDTVGVRQALEWRHRLDITRPLSHRSIAGFPDVLKARFVAMTGTVGEKLAPRLEKIGARIHGRGSEARSTVDLQVYGGPRQTIDYIHAQFRELIGRDLRRVAHNREPDGLMPVGLPSNRMLHQVVRSLRERPLVFRGSEMTPRGEAWLLRSGFTVRRVGGEYHVHPGERNIMGIRIQKVGAQQLSAAELGFTENATILQSGTAKLGLWVTSKAGRGVDLPFKGSEEAGFGGYRHYEMLVVQPQFVSNPEFTQLLGRIDLGRVPPGSTRRFRMILDMESAYRETYFSAMLREEPVFGWLRDRYFHRLERFARQDGVWMPDARHYQRLIEELGEPLRTAPRRDGRLYRPQDLRIERLIARYQRAVRRALVHGQMGEAEIRGYQASGTGQEAGRSNPYQWGLEPGLRPGLLQPAR